MDTVGVCDLANRAFVVLEQLEVTGPFWSRATGDRSPSCPPSTRMRSTTTCWRRRRSSSGTAPKRRTGGLVERIVHRRDLDSAAAGSASSSGNSPIRRFSRGAPWAAVA